MVIDGGGRKSLCRQKRKSLRKEASAEVVFGFQRSKGQGHFLDPRLLSPGRAWGQSPRAPPSEPPEGQRQDRGWPGTETRPLLPFVSSREGTSASSWPREARRGSLRSRAAGQTPRRDWAEAPPACCAACHAPFQAPAGAHGTVPDDAHGTVPAH